MLDITTGEALFADIILPLHLPQEYTYRIPVELEEHVVVGQRVVVQFGKKRIYSGIVSHLKSEPPHDYEAKYILGILDDHPLIGPNQLKLWRWMAKYYMCSTGEVMNAALPSALKLQSETKIAANEAGMKWKENVSIDKIDPLEVAILNVLQKGVDLTVDQVGDVIGKSNPYKYIKSLLDREFIEVREEIKERYKPKTVRKIKVADHITEGGLLEDVFSELENRAPAQLNVLLALTRAGEDMEAALLAKEANTTSTTIRALIDKGILDEYLEEIDRLPQNFPDELKVNEMNAEQKTATAQIRTAFEQDKVALLFGKTSSGKTHVYIQLIEEAIEKGGQVLYLLPEISLTAQLVRRIKAYFGDKVMVSHSKFSANERVEIWHKLQRNEIQIVLAPRSGIFMPFTDLRLIVVDEEHENSYKQNDPAPRFNARDTAVVISRIWDCNIILGSATPSVESYYNAEQGKYELITLDSRYSGVSEPEFHLVDVKEARRKKEVTGLFSHELRDRIKTVIEDKEQVILFQNRKGYVPVTECTHCGWAPRCVNCDITLTYYKFDGKLKCHYCGYTREPVQQCPACGNHSIHLKGYGTERVQDELSMLFPEATSERFDSETTRKKAAFDTIISRFEHQEIDVLIGTQMITKGLDFDHVKLVGVMDADHSLNQPDFRAHERSFQLFTQVGGRAGRRKEQGQVIIQTTQTGHPVLRFAKEKDYLSLYQKEITDREKFKYPPFYRLIHILVKDRSSLLASKAADYLVFLLKPKFGDYILGPQDPYVSKIRGQYLKSILIKMPAHKGHQESKDFIQEKVNLIRAEKDYHRTRIIVDVDPY